MINFIFILKSQFHNHVQYICHEVGCLVGHMSCKHGGLYEYKPVEIFFKI